MGFSNLLLSLHIFQVALVFSLAIPSVTGNSNLFREYIGAEFNNVKFSDVPINPDVEFHFILSFALDYTTSSSPSPTNGKFNVLWDTDNLTPSQVSAIKTKHKNVKVALSLGGDTTVGNSYAYFKPSSVKSWLSNAVPSLAKIIRDYHLDGIDIDYEHFKADATTFAECMGELISTLKKNGVISFASIAPYDDGNVQEHYRVLWRRYGNVIDYVNFQFYAYDEGISVKQFLEYFDMQSKNYDGGKVLVSFSSDRSGGGGGLAPGGGFFTACRRLRSRGNLHGIFVWSADDSKGLGFQYEKMSQLLLAS